MGAYSDEFITRMMQELSGIGYGYRSYVAGCYDSLANHYGWKEPSEGKEATVNEVLRLLRGM